MLGRLISYVTKTYAGGVAAIATGVFVTSNHLAIENSPGGTQSPGGLGTFVGLLAIFAVTVTRVG